MADLRSPPLPHTARMVLGGFESVRAVGGPLIKSSWQDHGKMWHLWEDIGNIGGQQVDYDKGKFTFRFKGDAEPNYHIVLYLFPYSVREQMQEHRTQGETTRSCAVNCTNEHIDGWKIILRDRRPKQDY